MIRPSPRVYVTPTHYTPDELERMRLADLLNDARGSFRDTRKGGYWEGNADMIAYAEKCHAQYKAGIQALRAKE